MAASACTQRWSYDGADRLFEENDGHGARVEYELTPAGGIKIKRDAASGAVLASAEFDGARMTR